MTLLRRFGWATAALCWVSATWAGEAEALVERMMAATKQLDYEGIFVYQRDASLETLRVLHRGSGETEMERLVSLNGPAREVIRDGRKVTYRGSDNSAVLVAERSPREGPNFSISGSVAGLTPSYHFKLQHEPDRIAGRSARVVHIHPRTNDRYAYRLWIDQDTALLLKSVILDAQERPLEQEQFATVNIGVALADTAFGTSLPVAESVGSAIETAAASGQRPVDCGASPCAATGHASESAAAQADWNIGWLPAGFSQHREGDPSVPALTGRAHHFVYSDGLATVAVFVERLEEKAPALQGFSFMGAVNTFSRVAAGHQITVIGDIPQATVRKIAVSVAPGTPTGK